MALVEHDQVVARNDGCACVVTQKLGCRFFEVAGQQHGFFGREVRQAACALDAFFIIDVDDIAADIRAVDGNDVRAFDAALAGFKQISRFLTDDDAARHLEHATAAERAGAFGDGQVFRNIMEFFDQLGAGFGRVLVIQAIDAGQDDQV